MVSFLDIVLSKIDYIGRITVLFHNAMLCITTLLPKWTLTLLHGGPKIRIIQIMFCKNKHTKCATERRTTPRRHRESVPIWCAFTLQKRSRDWHAFFVLPRARLFAKPQERMVVIPVFRNNLALGGGLCPLLLAYSVVSFLLAKI